MIGSLQLFEVRHNGTALLTALLTAISIRPLITVRQATDQDKAYPWREAIASLLLSIGHRYLTCIGEVRRPLAMRSPGRYLDLF
jgi:hypothetical protein